jgi:hypothetical protein
MGYNRVLGHFTNSQELATIWQSGQLYLVDQLVIQNNKIYKCVNQHTSGATFAGDIANWVLIAGGGSYVSSIQNSLTNGGNINIALTDGLQAIEVAGSGGEVILSSTPFGSLAPEDKTVLRIIGTSDTNTVGIVMSDVAKGAYLNGDVKLYLGYVLECMYIQSIDRWVESSRNF